MTKIILGTGEQGDVALDLGVLVETRMLIQSQSGGGKTTTLRRILEQSHGHVQQIVLDPEGEFYTLREKYDYIIAGKGGDCAADPRSAKLLARRLLELGVSAVCDLYELKAHDRIRFVRHFLEALIDAPRSLRHPVLVVIDEAHLFCPEKGQAESAPAVIDLATRGRKRGLTAVLATQRLSKLHKDAAAELRNVLIGATGLDIDQVRAGDVLGFSKADRLALRDLKWREFYAYGPALSPGVIRMVVGDTETKNPEQGHELAAPPPPTAKVRALLAKVADLPAEAEAEARDNESLRRELAETRRKLTLAEKNAASACGHEEQLRRAAEEKAAIERDIAELEAKVTPLYEQGQRFKQYLADVASGLRSVAEDLDGDIRNLELSDEVDAVVRGIRRPDPHVVFNRKATVKRDLPKPAKQTASPKPSTNGHHVTSDLDGITGGALRMLQRLAERYPETWTRAQLATLARIKRSGGTFGTYYSRLMTKGLIAEEGGRVAITEEGLRLMGGPPLAPQSHDDLIDSWRERLTGGARRMFDELLEAGERGLSREELAERAEIASTGGTFGTYLSRLMTNGLVERRGEMIVATPLLLGVE